MEINLPGIGPAVQNASSLGSLRGITLKPNAGMLIVVTQRVAANRTFA